MVPGNDGFDAVAPNEVVGLLEYHGHCRKFQSLFQKYTLDPSSKPLLFRESRQEVWMSTPRITMSELLCRFCPGAAIRRRGPRKWTIGLFKKE